MLIRSLQALGNLLVVDGCVACGSLCTSSEMGLCESCRGLVPQLPSSSCRRCAQSGVAGLTSGRVQEVDSGLCEDCIRDPQRPTIRCCASLSGELLPALLHRFKYGGEFALSRPLGSIFAQGGRRLLKGYSLDAVVPVPLHDRRLRSRGFNQAAVLARALCRELELPLIYGLERGLATPPQALLTAAERAANLEGAFTVRESETRRLKGARLLLVDDVVTTTWTMRECMDRLRAAGASCVAALALARTPRSR